MGVNYSGNKYYLFLTRYSMIYQWEKIMFNMPLKMKKEVEREILKTIISDVVQLIIFFAIAVIADVFCFKYISINGIYELVIFLALGVELPIMLLFIVGFPLIKKRKAYKQAKEGKFMFMQTKFQEYGYGNHNTASYGINVLFRDRGVVRNERYSLLGRIPRVMNKDNNIVLFTTECFRGVFIFSVENYCLWSD